MKFCSAFTLLRTLSIDFHNKFIYTVVYVIMVWAKNVRNARQIGLFFITCKV